METLKKSLFGLSAVSAGKRNVQTEPELICVSSSGSFRVTPIVSKALNLASGDYVMFISNRDNIDAAIAEQHEALVAFCKERDLDITTISASNAIHAAFDEWGICKGIQLFDKAGNPRMTRERLGSKVKSTYVENKYDEILEALLASDNKELIAAVTREGITTEEIKEIMYNTIQGDETPKFDGSKCFNPSNLTGVNVPLTFTDSNIWNQIKSDLGENMDKMNKIYSVNVNELTDVSVFNGYKHVTCKVAMLGESRVVSPVRVGDKKDDGTVVTAEDANDESAE